MECLESISGNALRIPAETTRTNHSTLETTWIEFARPSDTILTRPSPKPAASPLLLVLAAAVIWSTGGLFIKWTSLSGEGFSFGRSLLAAITVAIFMRRAGFGLNLVTAVAAILDAALLLLFVLATKATTVANAIFLQETAPLYALILEPLFYKSVSSNTADHLSQ